MEYSSEEEGRKVHNSERLKTLDEQLEEKKKMMEELDKKLEDRNEILRAKKKELNETDRLLQSSKKKLEESSTDHEVIEMSENVRIIGIMGVLEVYSESDLFATVLFI